MYLLIYCCGTGDDGGAFKESYEPLNVNAKTVKTLLVKGCGHSEVCNSFFPNLHEFAKQFVDKVFAKDGEQLKLSKEPIENLKVGTEVIQGNKIPTNEDIKGIVLCGYSRGAVTCFEITKELNKIAPNIPVYICANQPIPGSAYQGFGTNAESIADCSELDNLRKASIILGAYTGKNPNLGEDEDSHSVLRTLFYSIMRVILFPIHRIFFSQIVPKLPIETKRDLIVIPREGHFQPIDEQNGQEILLCQVTKYLNELNLGCSEILKINEYSGTINFPPLTKLQPIFGMNTQDIYMYSDKMCLTRHLRQGFEWNTSDKAEKLIDWWDRHDKNASFFSTELTKKLKKEIEQFNAAAEKDICHQNLVNIYAQADEWLMQKEGCRTSRRYQVEALRNNIFYFLTTHEGMKKKDLYAKNLKLLRDNKFFQKHWNRLSSATASSRINETTILDDAFNAYEESHDETDLLNVLNTWLGTKENRTNPLYDTAFRIREHLQQVIENNKIQSNTTACSPS
jgi:hypothetical protein